MKVESEPVNIEENPDTVLHRLHDELGYIGEDPDVNPDTVAAAQLKVYDELKSIEGEQAQ